MKKLAVLVLCGITIQSYSQVGKTFPDMETETLTNEVIMIPADIQGKFSLLGLAFSKKSEEDLKTWFNPLYETFLRKKEKTGLFDVSYDINGLFIPMFSGAKKAAYGKVMKKMQKDLDPRLQPYVVFYKGALKDYKNVLNFQGKDVPYFYVLNPDAKIVTVLSGKYTDEKMREIVNAVQDAMNF